MRSLLAPLIRQPDKPIFGTVLGGEAAQGRGQPRDFRAMVRADNDWVYRCARVNAENVGKVRLRLFRRSTDEPVDQHPFLDLLRVVNDGMNRMDLFELTELFLELIGNSYWYLAPTRLVNPRSSRRVPGEIWPLLGQHVTVIPGRARLVEGYLYALPGAPKVAFTPEDIVHFKFPSADSMLYGKGPVEGGRAAVATHEQMARYEEALFRNMARPDGALSTDKTLTTDQIRQLRTEWSRVHQGADRSGSVAILQGGLSYQQLATSPKELDYLGGKRYTREQVCAMFNVPLSKLGIEVAPDRAAAEAHDLTYQKETIQPRLTRVQEKLNEKVLPIYDEDLECRFDDPVPANNEFALTKRDSDLDRGVITINEVREREGLGEGVPWGDEPFVRAPSINFGLPDDETDEEPEKAALIRAARKSGPWERFIAATWPIERAWRTSLRQFFVEQRRTVEANLERARGTRGVKRAVDPLLSSILFPLDAEGQKLAALARPLLEQSLAAGAALGAAGLADMDFDVLNPLVSAALEHRLALLGRVVNEETARRLTDALRAGIEAGESVSQLAERVEGIYEQAVGFRSLRIARTETLAAANRGALLAYEAGGATEKRWVTAGDEHVRESHARAAGQTVGVQQKFLVGGSQLDHPGDPDADPSETINCRCTTVAVVKRQ